MKSLPAATSANVRTWLALLAIPALPLALLACGGESGGESDGGGLSSSSSGMGGDGGSGAGTTTSSTTSSGTSSGSGGALGSYPSPPYGSEVDDTFPFLSWEGWINPGADQLATGGTYGPFDSEGIRTAGESHALVHLAADF